jgi:integrase
MIPLLPMLAAELRAHRQHQGAKEIDRIRPEALVFQTVSGKPLHRRNVLHAVQNAADGAGLNGKGREPVGCHDLRHSTAAFAFSIGMTPVEVAQLLRHSDPAITLSTYAGLDGRECPEARREARCRLPFRVIPWLHSGCSHAGIMGSEGESTARKAAWLSRSSP